MTMNPDQFSAEYPPPPPGAAYMPPADPYALRVGFGKRLGAWFIDLVVMLIVSGIVGTVAGATLVAMFSPDTGMDGMEESMAGMMSFFAGFTVAMGFVGVLYSLVELFTGATPAKHILGIIVAHEDRRQGDIALYAKRWAVKTSGSIIGLIAIVTGITALGILGNIIGVIIFIGCFFVLGEKKQALHDMAAKTAVFHKEDVVPAGAVPAGAAM